MQFASRRFIDHEQATHLSSSTRPWEKYRLQRLALPPLLIAAAIIVGPPLQAQTSPATTEETTLQGTSARVAADQVTEPAFHPTARIHRSADPRITIQAVRDTIFAGLEQFSLLLERETPGNRLTVTVKLEQEEEWLADRSREVTFSAGDSIAFLDIPAGDFNERVTRSGDLKVTVDDVSGYDTSDAEATLFVVSSEGPVVTYSLSQPSYTFAEDVGRARAQLVARMASGMPRGVTVGASIGTRGNDVSGSGFTATPGEDYEQAGGTVLMVAEKYGLEDGRWVGRTSVIVPLLDDDVREGTEAFELNLRRPATQSDNARLLNSDGSTCGDRCRHLIHISDDEDSPALDLSVSPNEIMEQGETSATATVSITGSKSFAADQSLTLALTGSATEGADYVVSPADADEETADYQMILPVDSTSVEVTFKAMRDEVDDPGEKIEVSVEVDGNPRGDKRDIRIVNQRMDLPKITLVADRDTVLAGLEDLELTVTLAEPSDEHLTLTVRLTQEQNWLRSTSVQLNFPAGSAIHELGLGESVFSSAVTQSGTLTATVDSLEGYDTGEASVTVYVVSRPGPAMKVFFSEEVYQFAEDGEDPFALMVVETAPGMPRAATVTFAVSARAGTAKSPGDYGALSAVITVPAEDFTSEGGLWRTRHRVPLTLLDDEVREGTESFRLLLERTPSHPRELQLSNVLGNSCEGECAVGVRINDDEDIPEWELSSSAEEIREEGETSSTATVSITNGKTFADDQVVTFELGGDAIPEHDYRVAPADAAQAVEGHQVTLSAGSSSVEATFTAVDDEREEGDEKIKLRAIHDDNAIGRGTIRIIDRFPGPRVEITFEEVQPPRDEYDDGIATGPFSTRITFSEQVEGFTQEDIDWQTHSGTTVDTTNIGVLLWDYTEVRAGLEYTVRMMPDQDGRLHIVVFPDSARSVATGDGNQLGHGSLQVELPPDRMLVEPRTLTVDEGDADGAHFVVLLTSEPTGPVTVMVTGAEGTDLTVDRPTLTFSLPYWNGGWGVTVSALDDADAADEQVRLRVKASGGGYDGRSVDLVVNVRDDDGGSADQPRGVGPLQTGSEEALKLLGNVTPDAAAAALLGEGGLSEAQLNALDRLGNRNGRYDLGDMLSWAVRCRRAERSNRPRRRRSRCYPRGHRPDGRGRRRRSRARTALPFLAAVTLAWGCDQGRGLVEPSAGEPEPGFLAVELTAPAGARLSGARLAIEGPDIGALHAPGSEVFESDDGTRKEVIVAGALSAGRLLEFRVPDRRLDSRYRVRLIEVTGEDYQPRDVSAYSTRISR